MKILIATGLYPPDIGGPATYARFLETHLPQRGIEVVVVSFSVFRKYPKVIRHILYTYQLCKAVRTCDRIYALDTVSVGVPAMIVSRLTGKPLYLRVPGDYAWEQGQQRFGVTMTLDEYLLHHHRPFLVRVLAWVQTRVARSATRVIVPSEYMKGVVEKWGVPPEKITRIYSALHEISVPTPVEELRLRFEYSGFVVTSAARLTPWKGMAALIESVVALKAEGVKISLYVLGDGVERKNLETLIIKNDASSYVHLVGSVGKDELAERIQASDVFVLNTSYEGLSHQLLEVMDIGVPIITTPVGGNVELIADEREGLFVPYNDTQSIGVALRKIQTDTQLRAKLIDGAKKKVAHFKEGVIVEEIIKLFL